MLSDLQFRNVEASYLAFLTMAHLEKGAPPGLEGQGLDGKHACLKNSSKRRAAWYAKYAGQARCSAHQSSARLGPKPKRSISPKA